jgi:hypothetical protein
MITDWRAKFKQYAIEHNQILHNDASNKVFIVGYNEMQAKNLPELIIVLKENPSSFRTQNNDMPILMSNFEFMFLQSTRKDGPIDEEAAYNLCNQLALDFISRMIKERSLNIGDINRIKVFNVAECRIEKMALLDKDNRFGASLIVAVGDSNTVVYDESKWNL